jgi:hypothetical protein
MAGRLFNTGSGDSTDSDRRVEPRTAISGSGMMTDPARIAEIEAEHARRERAWRNAPEQPFGAVLEKTPAKEQDQTGVYLAAASEGENQTDAEDEIDEDMADTNESLQAGADDAPDAVDGERSARSPSAAAGSTGKEKLPRVPPDPRIAALHKKWDAKEE